jgi:hypothetical protein
MADVRFILISDTSLDKRCGAGATVSGLSPRGLRQWAHPDALRNGNQGGGFAISAAHACSAISGWLTAMIATPG